MILKVASWPLYKTSPDNSSCLQIINQNFPNFVKVAAAQQRSEAGSVQWIIGNNLPRLVTVNGDLTDAARHCRQLKYFEADVTKYYKYVSRLTIYPR